MTASLILLTYYMLKMFLIRASSLSVWWQTHERSRVYDVMPHFMLHESRSLATCDTLLHDSSPSSSSSIPRGLVHGSTNGCPVILCCWKAGNISGEAQFPSTDSGRETGAKGVLLLIAILLTIPRIHPLPGSSGSGYLL